YSQREAWLMMTLLRVLLEGYIPGDATGNIFKCLDSPSAVTFNTSRIGPYNLKDAGCILFRRRDCFHRLRPKPP
ncbi:MAG TPA: hypothetical protein VL523_15750, partial [Terriglobia bacterium]|nr:hypothetical protein [Terriglobia bacterium]